MAGAGEFQRSPQVIAAPWQWLQRRPRLPVAHQHDTAVLGRSKHDIMTVQGPAGRQIVIPVQYRGITAYIYVSLMSSGAQFVIHGIESLAEIAVGLCTDLGPVTEQFGGPGRIVDLGR